MTREVMEADLEANWPGDYSAGAVRCYCRVFITGEAHHWLGPHAQIPGLCVPARRPWWWWLAVVTGAGWLSLAAWVIFRTIAGWPVEYSWLQRLAG